MPAIFGKIGGFVAGVFSTIWKAGFAAVVYVMAKSNVVAKMSKKAKKVRDKQLEDAAKPPMSWSEILKEMKEGRM